MSPPFPIPVTNFASSSSAPFDPTTITGCVRWFDFSDTAAGNITTGATAADIAAIRDKVTSAAWWTTNGTATREPALVTGGSGIGGLQACEFTQVAGSLPVQYLTIMDAITGGSNISLKSNLGSSFSFSLFLVGEFGIPNTSAGFAATYNNPGIVSASGYWGFHSDGWVVGNPFWMRAYMYDAGSADKYVELAGNTAGQTFQSTMSFTDPGSGAGLVNPMSYWMNQGLVGTVSSRRGYDNPGGGTGWSDEVFLGMGWNGSGAAGGWWGKVGEVIIYDNEVSAPDRALIENYLKTKWSTP